MPAFKRENDYSPAEWAAAGITLVLATHYVNYRVNNLQYGLLSHTADHRQSQPNKKAKVENELVNGATLVKCRDALELRKFGSA